MRRQERIWTGSFPFILGLMFLFGCFVCSVAARAERSDPESLPAIEDGQGTVSAVDDGAKAETGGTTSKSKAARSSRKVPAQNATAPAADPQTVRDGIGTPAAARKQYNGKTVSLDLMDADIRNVLRLISDLTAMNIVVEPEVTGKVTLKVDQVPWDQVLDMVLSMNDLGKEQVGNVIRIAKQAKLRQEYLQQTEAIKAKQSLAETSRDMGEISTMYLPINFAKPSEIAAKISDAKSERGKVAVDERTSLIIYTDYPGRVANARRLIERLDRPTPQVLIEARLITLTSDVRKELGSQLSFSTQSPVKNMGNTQGFQMNGPNASNLPAFAANTASIIGRTLVNVDLQIQALESMSLIRLVAAPRVLTLDNVKAVVTQGTQVPYLMVGDTAANVTAVSFKDAVLELAVTPHITPDRKVRMIINAKQDSVSANSYNVGSSTEPGIDTRKIQTELLVDDGNVIVIGGAISDQSTVTKSATPGLADVPILGRLFKDDTTRDQKNELLIFISPRIVEVSKPNDKT